MDTAVQNEKTDLGTGKVGRLLFRLAIPTVAAQVVNVLYNMVDRMYIGHIDVIGAQALTGVGVCMPLIMIISAFAALAGMGGAPRASIMMTDTSKARPVISAVAAAPAGAEAARRLW